MIRVEFSVMFDDVLWSTPIAEESGEIGLARVGELGFVDLLAVQMGLKYPDRPGENFVRQRTYRDALAASLAKKADAFYAASFGIDPLAVAEALLLQRDLLVRGGWNGSSVDGVARIDTFVEVEKELDLCAHGSWVKEGPWDLLREIEESLVAGSTVPGIAEITILESQKALCSPRWSRIFERLESTGVKISKRVETSIGQSASGSDLHLAATCAAVASPKKDESLQILRGRDPWDSARSAAAWLANLDPHSRKRTVIVADRATRAILREALNERNLAFGGDASVDAFARPGIQILLLALQLLWSPKDAGAALALLMIQGSPVRSAVARQLASALAEKRAVGSPIWQIALKSGLADIDSKDDQDKVEARVKAWFDISSYAPEDGAPCDAVIEVCKRVSDWLRVRFNADDEKRNPSFRDGMEGAVRLADLVKDESASLLTPARLTQLVNDAILESVAIAGHESQAGGIYVVTSPAQIQAPADIVVWWNFTLASAKSSAAHSLWSKSETEKMTKAGIRFDDPHARGAIEATSWSRALQLAKSAALLVTWREDEAGEASHLHPAFSEWTGNHRKQWIADLTADRAEPELGIGPRFFASCGVINDIEGPSPFRERSDWKGPTERLVVREIESPSSMKMLLGCELQYALRYQTTLYGSSTHATKIDSRLKGTIVHELLAMAYTKGSKPDLNLALKKAEANIDELIRQGAPELFRPVSEHSFIKRSKF